MPYKNPEEHRDRISQSMPFQAHKIRFQSKSGLTSVMETGSVVRKNANVTMSQSAKKKCQQIFANVDKKGKAQSESAFGWDLNKTFFSGGKVPFPHLLWGYSGQFYPKA